MTVSRIAQRVRRIKPSPSTAVAERAIELRRQGQPVVNLAVGEPDFDTPRHIRQAAMQAIDSGATRYTATAGTMDLRQAIAAKLARENGLHYGTDEIIVTSGAKSAIYNCLAVTIEPGNEVIVPAPFWVSYPDMVIACDGVPVIVPCPETCSFKLQPDQLERAITPRTRWLLLNSPSNPTGATYTAAEYRALADVLLHHPNVMVMTDDIYEHIRFDGATSPHILAVAPELRDRAMLVNGVSKTYAMTGWRIGYVAGPRDLIRAIDTLLSQSSGNCCSISQAAATEALNGDQSFVAESIALYKERRDRMLKLINGIPGLSCVTPAGAFYLYVSCAGVIGKTTPSGTRLATDEDVARYLLEAQGVALVPGAAYGLSPYIRLSIATSMAILEEGSRRIASAIAELR